MTTVDNMIGRIRTLNVKEVSYESVVESKDEITDIQREQMYKGLNAEGKKIGRYRNARYARVKNEMNPLPGIGIPDLKLTGAFYGGFETKVNPETFSTFSTDIKNDALTEKYDPFGLDGESEDQYAEKLRPVFVKNVKAKLNL